VSQPSFAKRNQNDKTLMLPSFPCNGENEQLLQSNNAAMTTHRHVRVALDDDADTCSVQLKNVTGGGGSLPALAEALDHVALEWKRRRTLFLFNTLTLFIILFRPKDTKVGGVNSLSKKPQQIQGPSVLLVVNEQNRGYVATVKHFSCSGVAPR
jgi:hypothetical protein